MIVVGIDPSSKALALTALLGVREVGWTDFCQRKYSLSDHTGDPQALLWAYMSVDEFIGDLDCNPRECFVYIEAPIVGRGGAQVTINQAFVSGAIQVRLVTMGVPYQLVVNTSWKKHLVGKGNAAKDEIGAALRQKAPALWRSARGDQDIMDSSGIAYYGVVQALRERRIANGGAIGR